MPAHPLSLTPNLPPPPPHTHTHPLTHSHPPHPGAPPPQYNWAKDNVPLAGSTAFDISVPRELRITNVQVIHNGTYRCTIQNKIGERLIGARSTTAQLFVISMSLVLYQEACLSLLIINFAKFAVYYNCYCHCIVYSSFLVQVTLYFIFDSKLLLPYAHQSSQKLFYQCRYKLYYIIYK